MTRPLSIVHTENSCGWGGQEIRILTEARAMQDRGHRLTLIAPLAAEVPAVLVPAAMAEATPTAVIASAAVCMRPSVRRSASFIACTPSDTRLTPAER